MSKIPDDIMEKARRVYTRVNNQAVPLGDELNQRLHDPVSIIAEALLDERMGAENAAKRNRQSFQVRGWDSEELGEALWRGQAAGRNP